MLFRNSAVFSELIEINTLRNKIAQRDPVVSQRGIPFIDTLAAIAVLKHNSVNGVLFSTLGVN